MADSRNCQYADHQQKPIEYICVDQKCKLTSRCCLLCIQNLHDKHLNNCLSI